MCRNTCQEFRNIPEIVCLCGSTKFKNEFEILNKLFTLKGYIVLSFGVFHHADEKPLPRECKDKLDELHKRKIDLADKVFIVNVNGYIGSSTKSEIEYARSKGKNIQHLFPVWEP